MRATPARRRSKNASAASSVVASFSQYSRVAEYTAARIARFVYQLKSAEVSPAACQIASTVRAVHRAESKALDGCASRKAARRTAGR